MSEKGTTEKFVIVCPEIEEAIEMSLSRPVKELTIKTIMADAQIMDSGTSPESIMNRNRFMLQMIKDLEEIGIKVKDASVISPKGENAELYKDYITIFKSPKIDDYANKLLMGTDEDFTKQMRKKSQELVLHISDRIVENNPKLTDKMYMFILQNATAQFASSYLSYANRTVFAYGIKKGVIKDSEISVIKKKIET